jgi:hypothetical protein
MRKGSSTIISKVSGAHQLVIPRKRAVAIVLSSSIARPVFVQGTLGLAPSTSSPSGWTESSALDLRSSSLHATDEAALVRLDSRRRFKQQDVEHLVAYARHRGSRLLEDLVAGNLVACNFTHVTTEQAISSEPFDLSWWRGGIGLIGAMRLDHDKQVNP